MAARGKSRLRGVAGSMLRTGLGVGFGIGIGLVWSVSDLLEDWWSEPGTTVLLAPEDPSPEPAPLEPVLLEQFRKLQEGSPSRSPRVQEAEALTHPVASPGTTREKAAAAELPKGAAALIAEIAREATAPPSPGTRVVQVASEPSRSRADALLLRLADQGFRAYVSESHPSGSLRHRVRVVPGPGDRVSTLADGLERRGFSVWTTTE